jgi:molybdopterin-guanine dinucleotide biosynthesis protein A
MEHARAIGAARVLTIGCDMPRVPETLIGLLVERGVTYCADAPVLGVWPSALGPSLVAHLAGGGERSIRRWADANGLAGTSAPTALPNVNTPEDLLAL